MTMPLLKPGNIAPPFEAQDQSGRTVRLSDFAGRKLFVYFFPKANTSGPTTQAEAVRDALPRLKALDVAAVGISPDSSAQQKKFDEKYSLGFPLLSDSGHSIAEAYGVWGEKKMYGKTSMGIIRSAFLIDDKGTILKTWYKISPKDTVPELIKALGA
jgi:thioredoxin-dependent peroxiredoxin